MARVLENIKLFVSGDPESTDPSSAMITYSVVDGNARKDNCTHVVSSPTWTKTGSQFWTDEIALIKTAEGIS